MALLHGFLPLFSITKSITLQEAQCFRTIALMRRYARVLTNPCLTIARYEASKHVLWRGLHLVTTKAGQPSKKLSEIKTQYLQKIRDEIETIFPDERSGSSLMDLSVFDHRMFKETTDATLRMKFRRACKFIGYSNIPQVYIDEYITLVNKIKADPLDLCDKSKSSPRLTWTDLLERYTVSEFLRKMIVTVIIMPFGSAEGE